LKSDWKIHKFGGSSLADADCFRRVARLLLAYSDNRMGIVVSAMGGITDAFGNGRCKKADNNPLVVQGPGAGPEVTAGGVFSDLLRLAKYLSEGD